MRLRTIQAGPLMQMPVFLILFIAPVYVPLALLGEHVARRRDGSIRSPTRSRRAAASSPATRPTSRSRSASRSLLAVVFSVWALRGLRSAEAAG